jgi:hypothetical protein
MAARKRGKHELRGRSGRYTKSCEHATCDCPGGCACSGKGDCGNHDCYLRYQATLKNPKRRKNPPKPGIGARASYMKTHWGDPGNGSVEQGEAVDVCKEELVTLGVLREIAYETVKLGDGGPAVYEHKFSRRSPPILAYGRKSGKLVIISGGYSVNVRGIVG